MSIQRQMLLPGFGTITITNSLNQKVGRDATPSVTSCSSMFFISAQTDSLKENRIRLLAWLTSVIDSLIYNLIFAYVNFSIFPVKRLCR